MNAELELTRSEQAPRTITVPPADPGGAVAVRQEPTLLSILDAAVRGGVTAENVAVVKEIMAMRREEMREQAKAAFNRAFVQLRRNMPEMYADKKALDRSGKLVYVYASEEEIARNLEPVLLAYGFSMLPGQRQENGLVTVAISLIHEEGHQEVREYTVHVGSANAMKDATAVDTGATTSAWRHLVMKMFGLKSRIREEDDARNVGDGSAVTPEQAEELERRANLLNCAPAFLNFAYAFAPKKLGTFAGIPANRYAELDAFLRRKEQAGK